MITLDTVEKNYMMKVIQSTGFNRTEAAEVMGNSRSTIWRRLKSLGLDIESVINPDFTRFKYKDVSPIKFANLILFDGNYKTAFDLWRLKIALFPFMIDDYGKIDDEFNGTMLVEFKGQTIILERGMYVQPLKHNKFDLWDLGKIEKWLEPAEDLVSK